MQPACTSPSDVVRSVKDFSKDSSLVEGLMVGLPCEQPDSAAVASAQHVRDRMDTCGPVVQKKLKTEPVWALTDIDVDPLNFEVNTLSHEFNRLQVLKSFCILDECKDDALDTLTGMGCRMFDTPVCLVSLVDLDRLWFVSNRGFGDAREILRENSLCSYCIMSKMDMIVVPDTTKDERFMRSPVVTGGAKVRFYAGAALVCPDGTYYCIEVCAGYQRVLRQMPTSFSFAGSPSPLCSVTRKDIELETTVSLISSPVRKDFRKKSRRLSRILLPRQCE
jgi:hypothetical protein